ncbi:28S ribosomal protein S33, mitochondrial [Merluccius polli]|uniref:Small ribosomal subunit protein mS33 n=1 Tax=Merluccius polli TaxID=89951 RepID=A0AA47MTA9_MERPO|nr:28S ribosomal protein S33, mitochondrial [Merluccius polli]
MNPGSLRRLEKVRHRSRYRLASVSYQWSEHTATASIPRAHSDRERPAYSSSFPAAMLRCVVDGDVHCGAAAERRDEEEEEEEEEEEDAYLISWLRVPHMASLSSYAVRMARLSARIFGDVVRPTDSKSMKVVQLFKEQPLGQRKEVYDWYPQHKIYYSMTQKLRFMGLFRDEHEDFKDEMRRLKKLRGKGKPMKGEGKRASKRK